MQTATSYLDRVLPAIGLVASRFAALVTAAPDPATEVPDTPGWTVRDVAAHVVTVVVRYADGPKGRGTWTSTPLELPALNHDQMRALGAVAAGDLAASLRQELATLQAQMKGYGSRLPVFRFHGGEPVRADIALGLLPSELGGPRSRGGPGAPAALADRPGPRRADHRSPQPDPARPGHGRAHPGLHGDPRAAPTRPGHLNLGVP